MMRMNGMAVATFLRICWTALTGELEVEEYINVMKNDDKNDKQWQWREIMAIMTNYDNHDK